MKTLRMAPHGTPHREDFLDNISLDSVIFNPVIDETNAATLALLVWAMSTCGQRLKSKRQEKQV